MFRLIYFESVKTFLKKRTYLGFVIVAVIVPLVEVAMKLEGGRFLAITTRRLQEDFLFVGNLFNGWFVALQIMNSLWFHIPVLISAVAGDQFSGEATAGTYRILLIRPASRTRVFFAKLLTTLFYTVLFVGFLGALSVGLALLLLGRGDMIVLDRGILILPDADVAWRFALAYILAACSMMTVACLALFFSSFVENAIGPIVATMGLLIVSSIVSVLPLEVFDSIRPYLFTTHLNVWMRAFSDPLAWGEIVRGLTTLASYSLIAVLAAWLIFTRRDILT
jgi:ABC-2 type transport system permease protein